MKKIVWKFGLISGGVTALFITIMSMVGGFQCDNDMGSSMLLGYAAMLLALSFVFFGVRSYRDKVNQGVVSFGKAFAIGLLIALIASAIYVIAWMIMSHIFYPNFMEDYTRVNIEKIKASGRSAAQIAEEIAEMEQFKEMYNNNPLIKIFFTFIEIFPVGLLVALITALILKRKQPKTPQTEAAH